MPDDEMTETQRRYQSNPGDLADAERKDIKKAAAKKAREAKSSKDTTEEKA